MAEEKIKSVLKKYFNSTHINEIINVSTLITLEEKTELLRVGSPISVIPMVISGSVKVYKDDEQGHNYLLYYINESETCVMTLNSCIMTEKSKIKAVTEEKTQILAIPSQYITTWMNTYPEMKYFLISVFSNRFEELLNTVNTLAFMNMDERVLNYLQNKSENSRSHQLKITHQQIADELNTSREVISRILKKLENDKKLKLSRNEIKLITT